MESRLKRAKATNFALMSSVKSNLIEKNEKRKMKLRREVWPKRNVAGQAHVVQINTPDITTLSGTPDYSKDITPCDM